MELREDVVVADRYRLVKMIGQGGMGSVWRAQHLGLDTPCAVKFIEGEMSKLAEAHQRFEREAKAAARLRSPHIVQIYDHGVWSGTPYIAMELLDGEDLGKYLASNGGRLPPNEVVAIVQQVCRALTKAHQAGIVHRDLKPDNIFLVNDDDRRLVKILDFGVAKETKALEGSATRTGAMLGTPYYMSPEQAQGIKGVDTKSDLWSLAVIVYQCLTGTLPFDSDGLGDLLVKIIMAPLPVPSQVASDLPPSFDRWWLQAAERRVEQRIPTAKDFAESLAAAFGAAQNGTLAMERSQPVLAGTAMMPGAPGAVGPATPNPVAQTGGFQAIPTPSAPMMAPHAQTADPLSRSFDGSRPASKLPVAAIAAVACLAIAAVGIGGFAAMRNKSASAATSSAAAAPPPPPAVTSAPTTVAATSTVAAVTPSAAPTVAAATPSAAADPPPGAVAGRPPTTPQGKPAGVAVMAAQPKPSAKPAASAPPAPPAASTPKGPINLGF